MIALVRQEDAAGCGIACLAMVTGLTYQEVKAEVLPCFDEHGLSTFEMDTFLAEHGYAVARKYQCITHQLRDRETWPPEPFGFVHIAAVVHPAASGLGRSHFVVWLMDGTIFDPWDGMRRGLDAYPTVHNVTAVTRLEEHA